MSDAAVDVCVIGGGLAGIAAALAAKQAGAQVLVLEAGARAGGKVQTVDGLERGPHSFNGRHPTMWRLLDALGLSAEATRLTATTRYLARGGQLHALAPSGLTLLRTGALTAREKLLLLKELIWPRPVACHATVFDFFAARLGTSFAEGPLAAMVSGIFAADPRVLSVDACFPELKARAVAARSLTRALLKAPATGRRGLFTLKGGLGRIGEAALRHLPIELGSPVRELSRDASGFRVQAGRLIHARSVVVATEAHAAARLLWPLSQPLGVALGKLQYAPLSVAHWEGRLGRSAQGLPGFGYLACPQERLFTLGALFHEHGRFSSFVRDAALEDGALLRGLEHDLRALGGGEVRRLLRVDRWPQAVFAPTVEALPVLESLPKLATEAGVLLAGSYLGASAMKDALASGFDAGASAFTASQRTHAWSRSLS